MQQDSDNSTSVSIKFALKTEVERWLSMNVERKTKRYFIKFIAILKLIPNFKQKLREVCMKHITIFKN